MPYTVLAYLRNEEDPRVIVGTADSEASARKATNDYFLAYPESVRHITRLTLLPLTQDGDIAWDAQELVIDQHGGNLSTGKGRNLRTRKGWR